MSLWDGLRRYGTGTFGILMTIVALDNLQSSGLATLAPNIRTSLHVSNAVIVLVSGLSGGFLILGILPMGWLNDRYRRAPLVVFATAFFGVMVFASGAAKNIFLFFLARFGAGISQASTATVHGSLLADTVPDQPARSPDRPRRDRSPPAARRPSARCSSGRSPPGRAVPTGGGGPFTSWPSPSWRWRLSAFGSKNPPEGSSRSSTCWARPWATPPPPRPP